MARLELAVEAADVARFFGGVLGFLAIGSGVGSVGGGGVDGVVVVGLRFGVGLGRAHLAVRRRASVSRDAEEAQQEWRRMSFGKQAERRYIALKISIYARGNLANALILKARLLVIVRPKDLQPHSFLGA